MFDYLQKFNSLPQHLKDQVSSPKAMKIISELEQAYGVDLAIIVMKVMVGDIDIDNLPIYFVSQLGLEADKAQALADDLRERVFKNHSSSEKKEIKEETSIKGEEKKNNYSQTVKGGDYHDNEVGISNKKKARIPFVDEKREEKKEIKNQIESEKKIIDVSPKPINLSEDIDNLIRQVGLILPSEELIKRLKSIISIYVKGIRNKIDTRATLMKDIDQGGLHLNLEQANRVIKICETKKIEDVPVIKTKPADNQLNKIIDQSEKTNLLTEEYNLKQAIKEKRDLDLKHELPPGEESKEKKLPKGDKIKSDHLLEPFNDTEEVSLVKTKKKQVVTINPVVKEKVNQVKKDIEDTKKESIETKKKTVRTIEKPPVKKIDSFVNIFSKKKKEGNIDKAKIVKEKKEVEEKKEIKKNISKVSRSAPSSSVVKPRISDIKAVPKVLSPVEELKYLSLVDFRRLGKTPKDIVAKVFSKIKFLEEDGYDKMILGIKAWRQSPINKLYLRLGQEAINQGISLEELVEKRKVEGKDYLSMEEIKAIIMLNSKLVF